MKKLLSILAINLLLSTSIIGVISCSPAVYNEVLDLSIRKNSIKNIEWQKVKSYKEKKVLKNTNNRLTNLELESPYGEDNLIFSPYVDISGPQDAAELLISTKGKTPNSRELAEKSLGDNNVVYNDLAKIGKDKEVITNNTEITLGFMQNASDTGELVPMWSAAPSINPESGGAISDDLTMTKHAKNFNEKYQNWVKNGSINTQNVRISFGPFSNSLWHKAHENNKSPQELAEVIKKVGEKYGTKKFDFYFTAPYSSRSGVYFDSQVLLASALSILADQDSNYDFQLSVEMSTKDGLTFQSDFINEDGEVNVLKVGEDSMPLYVFTKYLGMNFKLNLSTQYFTVSSVNDAGIDTDWEEKAIILGAKASHENWVLMHNALNGEHLTIEQTSKKIKITPLIGIRKDKAAYSFTPKDAINLRKTAIENNYGGVGMFFLSKDTPSEIVKEKGNGQLDDYIDKNPLKANLISGMGYEKFTFAKILNGTITDENQLVGEEVATKEEILELGSIDFQDNIESNTSLDSQQNWSDWQPESSNLGNEWIVEPKSGLGNRLLKTWQEANPNRVENDIVNEYSNSIVEFSPYLDTGLYNGGNLNYIPDLQSINLAYVKQNWRHNDSLDLTFAGQDKENSDYKSWEKEQYWPQILKPLYDSNNLNNIRVSYGGVFDNNQVNKNPWVLAYELSMGNMRKAADMLKQAFVKSQKENITDVVNKYTGSTSKNFPKKIDISIDGSAQFLDKQTLVLATALSELQKEYNGQWDISISIGTLPIGFTQSGFNILNVFVNAFSRAGLTVSDLPTVNLMTMDYSNDLFKEGTKKGYTFSDLVIKAVYNAQQSYVKSINQNFNLSLSNNSTKVLSKIGVTPMIGVNDTSFGVFTLEDAKELYNFANKADLSFISMWSINADRGIDTNTNIITEKHLSTHGLSYLTQYDFSKVFLGKWK